MSKQLGVHMKDGRTKFMLDPHALARLVSEKRITNEGDSTDLEPRDVQRCYWDPRSGGWSDPHGVKLRYISRNSIAFVEEASNAAE